MKRIFELHRGARSLRLFREGDYSRALGQRYGALRSLDAFPNNLPVELSTFVGRLAEIEAVRALSIGNRLVTVTGAGGAGKTRLAQQVAAQLTEQHPDGTWWIELASVGTADVGGAIASVLSITDPGRLVEGLAFSFGRLRQRDLVLVDLERE